MPDYRVKRLKITESLPDIVDLLADAWVEAANPAKRRRILGSASRGQQLLLGYHWYWDEVTNGGHWQYFWNYTGSLWREALEATTVLHLPEVKVLRSALALFPDKRPAPSQRERRQQLAKINRAKLDKLDDDFYRLSGDDKKIRQYIGKHPAEFFLPMRSK